MSKLSIIIPCYNEQDVISEFNSRLKTCLVNMNQECDLKDMMYEIIYINDGSTDNTLSIIEGFKDNQTKILNFSRNFGKEAATTAGLDYATGDAVVLIDADLQDPPEMIGDMIKKWHEGFDVVYAQRTQRDGETWLKKFTAKHFYSTMNRMGPVKMPENVGDFRLMDRKVINVIKQLPEKNRFMKGIFAWVGFQCFAMPYKRDARYAGITKWNYWKLWNFALDGITSYTVAPLKIPTYIGIIFALISFFVFIKSFIIGLIIFMFSMNFIFIGIIGEYIARIFIESKGRPIYVIDETNSHLVAHHSNNK